MRGESERPSYMKVKSIEKGTEVSSEKTIDDGHHNHGAAGCQSDPRFMVSKKHDEHVI